MIALVTYLLVTAPVSVETEDPVAPYTQNDENAGARAFTGTRIAEAFHGAAGIKRITDRLIELADADSRTKEIFAGHDHVRLRRTLYEQVCVILNAGCHYSGRTMLEAHKNMGLQQGDMNVLVELLQRAMTEEKVRFADQNRLLSKLAPMRPKMIER